jgi:hypothetical protein
MTYACQSFLWHNGANQRRAQALWIPLLAVVLLLSWHPEGVQFHSPGCNPGTSCQPTHILLKPRSARRVSRLNSLTSGLKTSSLHHHSQGRCPWLWSSTPSGPFILFPLLGAPTAWRRSGAISGNSGPRQPTGPHVEAQHRPRVGVPSLAERQSVGRGERKGTLSRLLQDTAQPTYALPDRIPFHTRSPR